jgi:transcriptional regulator with XRE-family HTH domain
MMDAKKVGVNQLGFNAKISPSTISSWREGKYLPHKDSLYKLAAHLKIDPEELFALLPSEVYTEPEIPSSILLTNARGILMVRVLDQEAGAEGNTVAAEYVYIHPSMVPKNHEVVAVRVRGNPLLFISDVEVMHAIGRTSSQGLAHRQDVRAIYNCRSCCTLNGRVCTVGSLADASFLAGVGCSHRPGVGGSTVCRSHTLHTTLPAVVDRG